MSVSTLSLDQATDSSHSSNAQPFYIAPSIGKQYINDDLPNYSLVISQNYIDILSAKEFHSMFSATAHPFSDLPTQQYSNLISFLSLYQDLKSGYYDLAMVPPPANESSTAPLLSLSKATNPTFSKQLHANCKQMIYSSQKWNGTTHNPLFTSFPPNPNPKYPYTAVTANINNAVLVENEFAQLCHPISRSLDHDSIVLRMTTTAHAIVFDIINMQHDPFLAYHSRNSSPTNVQSKPLFNGLIQLPTQIPTNDVNSSPNEINTDQQLSNASSIDLFSPLSLSNIAPSQSKPFSSDNQSNQDGSPLIHQTLPQHFDYFCLQPYSYSALPSNDSNYQLHLALYGSYSLKFIIPLGSLLAAPIHQFSQLSFSHHINRFSSQQYQPLPPQLDSMLTSCIDVNNSLAFKQVYHKRFSPLLSTLNTRLHELQGGHGNARSASSNLFTTTTTHSNTAQTNSSVDSTVINMTDHAPSYQITPAQSALSTIYLAIPDNDKIVNMVKIEVDRLRKAQQYSDAIPQSPDMNRDQVLQSPSAGSSSQPAFSPGGTQPIHPSLPNKYGVQYPRELKDNINSTVTTLHIVSLCTLYNCPVVTTWHQQYQLLLQMVQNEQAGQSVDIPQLTCNEDRCKDVHVSKLHSLINVAELLTNSGRGKQDVGRHVNTLPTFTHYNRHQIVRLLTVLRKNPTQDLIDHLVHKSPQFNMTLPTILSILHLFSQQIHLQDTVEKHFIENATVAAATSKSQIATEILPNILSHSALTYPLLHTSPVTAVWSILALPRPRSVIAAVNPFGGAGKAIQHLTAAYPLLYASNHQCYIYITQYGGDVIERSRVSQCAFGWDGDVHKEQYCNQLMQSHTDHLIISPSSTLSTTTTQTDSQSLIPSPPTTAITLGPKLQIDHFYDTFLCFSGDGLLNELINGIMKSHHWSWTLSRMAICHVPSGSGNGVASTVSSMSFYSTNPENAIHLALHGCSRKLDMFTVTSDPKRPNGKGYSASANHQSEEFQTRIDGLTDADGIDASVIEPPTQWETEDNGEYDPKVFSNAEFFTKHYASELALNQQIQIEELTQGSQFLIPTEIPISQPLPRGVYCGVLSLSWAFISDLDFESEKWRWCGGARFEWAAVVRILWLRKYKARIEILVDDMNEEENLVDYLKSHKMKIPKAQPDATRLTAEQFYNDIVASNPGDTSFDLTRSNPKANSSSTLLSNPPAHPSRSLTACGMNCLTCYQSLIDQAQLAPADRDFSRLEAWAQNKLHFSSRSSVLTHDIGNIHGNYIVKPDHQPLELNRPNKRIISEKWFPLYTNDETALSEADRKFINDDYTCIWGVNLSHGASDAIISPFSHCNDGKFDIYYVKDCARMDLLGMMTSINTGGHVGELAVEHVKVKGFRFDPTLTCQDGGDKQLPDTSCLMSLDGERIPLKAVELRSWNGIVNLICRL